jgi:hypothetical protein
MILELNKKNSRVILLKKSLKEGINDFRKSLFKNRNPELQNLKRISELQNLRRIPELQNLKRISELQNL